MTCKNRTKPSLGITVQTTNYSFEASIGRKKRSKYAIIFHHATRSHILWTRLKNYLRKQYMGSFISKAKSFNASKISKIGAKDEKRNLLIAKKDSIGIFLRKIKLKLKILNFLLIFFLLKLSFALKRNLAIFKAKVSKHLHGGNQFPLCCWFFTHFSSHFKWDFTFI